MPRAASISCANPIFVRLLEEWKAELEARAEEKDPDYIDQRATTIGKAIKSLRAHPSALDYPRDCGVLGNFGPWTVKGLDERYSTFMSEDGGEAPPAISKRKRAGKATDQDAAPKKRGRPNAKKPSAPSAEHRQSVSSSIAPGIVQIPRAFPTRSAAGDTSFAAVDDIMPFHFWYLDTEKKCVDHRDQAAVVFRNDYELWYSIELPIVQATHPLVSSLRDAKPFPGKNSTMMAIMSEQEAALREKSNPPIPGRSLLPTNSSGENSSSSVLSHSPAHARVPVPIPAQEPRASPVVRSLAEELRAEAQAKAKTNFSLNSARQRSGLPLRDQLKTVNITRTTIPEPSSGSSNSHNLPRKSTNISRSTSLFVSSAIPDPDSEDDDHAISPDRPIESLPDRSVATGLSINRTFSAPAVNFSSLVRPQPKKNPKPVFVATARGRTMHLREALRLSSHIPTPNAIDDVLEEHLDRAAGVLSSAASNRDRPRTASDKEVPFVPIIYPAGSYAISLILDSREIKSTKNREYIQKELGAKGVRVETRALELGDVTWVAKRKAPSGIATEDEAVLDFIIERKRIDDLIGSIKDGRFHEQKFRLKESGIGRVYYLVEEYKEGYKHKTMDQAVFTALSSTQIVDGFMLKETRDLDDTVEYLCGLHETILRLHENVALRVIPPASVHRHSYVDLQSFLRRHHSTTTFHTTYDSFRALNRSGLTTLRDYFSRMLLCVNGMSAEKVASVIAVYETPKALYEAFIEAEDAEQREKQEAALAEQESADGRAKGKGRAKGDRASKVVPAKLMLTRLPGNGRRHIGDALATKIYELFRAEQY